MSVVIGLTATITSCGEQYKPMSDEDIKAKATEKFEAEGKAAIEAAKAECAANMAMAVDAKVSEMMAAAAPAEAATAAK